jgi:hypothetical protein
MRLPRFSIASVMAFILYVAIGLTAYRSAGDPWYGRLWNDGFFMLTVGALAVATMQAVIRHDRSRARWLGFAVFGWVHLMFGWPDSGTTPLGGTWRPRFPHTELLSHALEWIFLSGTHREEGTFKWHIIQSSITIATAFVGAAIGNFLAARGERQDGH